MRQTIDLCQGWQFTGFDGKTIEVNVPHTWNNIDGQDGGNDYKRGSCDTSVPLPALRLTGTAKRSGSNSTASTHPRRSL